MENGGTHIGHISVRCNERAPYDDRAEHRNLSVRITFDFTDTTYLVRRRKLFPAPSPRFFAVNVLLGNAQVKSYSPNSVPR